MANNYSEKVKEMAMGPFWPSRTKDADTMHANVAAYSRAVLHRNEHKRVLNLHVQYTVQKIEEDRILVYVRM